MTCFHRLPVQPQPLWNAVDLLAQCSTSMLRVSPSPYNFPSLLIADATLTFWLVLWIPLCLSAWLSTHLICCHGLVLIVVHRPIMGDEVWNPHKFWWFIFCWETFFFSFPIQWGCLMNASRIFSSNSLSKMYDNGKKKVQKNPACYWLIKRYNRERERGEM